eukprot:6093720-Alexandrium_andersonii.AAC.1
MDKVVSAPAHAVIMQEVRALPKQISGLSSAMAKRGSIASSARAASTGPTTSQSRVATGLTPGRRGLLPRAGWQLLPRSQL